MAPTRPERSSTGAFGDTAATAARTACWWVPYVYLLRAHLIVAVVLVALPLYGRTSPLLNGLFDLEATSSTRIVLGMALITLAALATALTLLATAWSTMHNAPARFGVTTIRSVRFPISWPEREMFSVLAAPTIATVIWHSWHQSGVNVGALLVCPAKGGCTGQNVAMPYFWPMA